MAKSITLPVNDTEYTLEFSRATVKQIEAQGFRLGELFDMPATMIPLLVRGAFMKHHPKMSQKVIEDDIFANIGDKQGFLNALIGLYNETVNTLFDEPDEAKKIQWTTNQ